MLLFSRSVMSDSLQLHELQHTSLSCPSPSPGVCSNSCPLSWWCHPTILSSIIPFSCLHDAPSQHQGLFHGVDSSHQVAKVLKLQLQHLIHILMNIQGRFPLGLTGFYFLVGQGILRSLLWHHSLKASILQSSDFFMVQLSHPYMNTGKTTALTIWTFVGKIISLLFNMLSRLVIAFLPRSKGLLISCLQLPSAVILDPPKMKSLIISIVSLSICHEVMGPRSHDLSFLNVEF